jgi:hypothetical protein
MLTVSAAWEEAVLRADAETRLLVELYDGTNTYKAVSGSMDPSSDLATYDVPVAILAWTQIGSVLDALSRKMQVKAVELTVLDGWIRPIATNVQLARQRVRVFIGASCLDEADFVSAFVGEIEDIIPSPEDKDVATIYTVDLLSAVSRATVVSWWWGLHPAEALHGADSVHGYVHSVLDRAQIPATNFDDDSFDPTNSQFADIKNVLISQAMMRYVNLEPGWKKPYKASWRDEVHFGDDQVVDSQLNMKESLAPKQALDMIHNICQIIYAHVDFEETGSFRLVRFNASNSIVDVWDDEVDIFPGTFKQLSTGMDNLINRVVWNFGQPRIKYQVDDADSQSDYAYPGSDERVETYEITTPYLNDWSVLAEPLNTTDTSFLIGRAGIASISGNKSGLTVDSTSPVYLFLREIFPEEYEGDTESHDEVVKCEGMTRYTSVFGRIFVCELGGGLGDRPVWAAEPIDCLNAEMTSVTRNWPSGSPGKEHQGLGATLAYDATLPVITSEIILKRFKNGAPEIECETDISKFKYQIGDFIGPKSDRFMMYGEDGLDGTKKFEIIGKEVSQDLNSIKWKLLAVNDDSTNAFVASGVNYGRWSDIYRQLAQQTIAQAYKRSGLVITQSAGLVAQITAGTAANGQMTATIPQTDTYTCPASRDTYVTVDLASEMLIFTPVANGAGAPTIPNTEVLIGIIVTDGSGITSIDTSGTITVPIPGGYLRPGTGPLAQLNSSGYYNLAGNHVGALPGSSLAAGSGPLAQLNSSGQYDLGGTHQNTLPANTGVTPGTVNHYTWNRRIPSGGPALNGNRFGGGRTRVP